jgi:hypothetical protein
MDSQPELLAQHYAEAGLVEKSVAYWSAPPPHRRASPWPPRSGAAGPVPSAGAVNPPGSKQIFDSAERRLGRSASATPAEFVMDSPLEGTGFEPSVPLLQKAPLGVANRDVGTISGTT